MPNCANLCTISYRILYTMLATNFVNMGKNIQ